MGVFYIPSLLLVCELIFLIWVGLKCAVYRISESDDPPRPEAPPADTPSTDVFIYWI